MKILRNIGLAGYLLLAGCEDVKTIYWAGQVPSAPNMYVRIETRTLNDKPMNQFSLQVYHAEIEAKALYSPLISAKDNTQGYVDGVKGIDTILLINVPEQDPLRNLANLQTLEKIAEEALEKALKKTN